MNMDDKTATSTDEEEQLPEMMQPVQYPAGPESELALLRGRGKEAYSLAQITQFKAVKKVVAPYLRTARKIPKKVPDVIEKESEAARFKAVSYLNERLSVTIKVLQTYSTAENINLPGALYDTTDMLKNTTSSNVAVLYIVDTANGEIYQSPRHVQSPRHKVNWTIREGSTVACHVAATKKYVWVGDVLADTRFPEGVGWEGLSSTIKSVMCVPILSPENEIIAIIELCRDVFSHNYTRADVQMVVALAALMGAGIYQNQLRLTLLSQQRLSSRLLEFINLYFCDINISDIKILSDIMIYAKQVLQAEQASFYLIDPNSTELEADYYIQSQDDPNQIFKKKNRLKLAKLRSVAAHVVRTKQPLNVRDVTEDVRFKDTDKNSSEITRTALCEPIMDKDLVTAIIVLTNKKDNGYFTAMDEATFKIFSNYCSLSKHHYNVRKELRDKRDYVFINREILENQMKPCEHDLKRLQFNRSKLPKDILDFSWYPKPDHIPVLDEFAIQLYQKVCSDKFMFENDVDRFILAVKRAYRLNPHHNFVQAFVMLHGIFNILIRNKKKFSDFEQEAMMIAVLMSNVDHRGLNTDYFYVTGHSLATLYDNSLLENHHVYVTKMLIKNCQMFKYLPEKQYNRLMEEIEMLILHTDMERHLRCRARLKNILNRNAFDWENFEHRFLLKGFIMVASVLINKTKPLPVNEKLTANEYNELIKQNDQNKKFNLTPLIGMNRETAFMASEDEYNFMLSVVIPLHESLITLLPTTREILDGSSLLRDSWKELVEFRGKRLWKPEESLWKMKQY